MKRVAALVAVFAAGLVAGWLLPRPELPTPVGRWVTVQVAPVGGLATPSTVALPALADGPVRHVVLLVGDGLGLTQAAAARLRAFGPGGRFLFERFPVTGLIDTRPALGVIPKSDAAATALAAGVRTANGRIGTSTAGLPVATLVERAHARGLATGLVTTSWIYDATPAAFAAHVERRRDYAGILDQLAGAEVDLLAGGGLEAFDGAGPGRPARLAQARGRGIAVVSDVAGLAALDRLPAWALFAGRDLGESPARPDLAELAEKALELVPAAGTARGTGSFLLLEEEGIDSAAHDRDLERLSAAVLRFDRAVEAAVRQAAARGDMLVLVVGDHATGGLAIDHTSTAERLRVLWTSGEHTGEPVPVYAYGPAGAAARFTGLHDATAVHDRVAELLGLAGPAAP